MLRAAYDVLVSAGDEWRSAKAIFKALQSAAACKDDYSSVLQEIANEKGYKDCASFFTSTEHIVATACMAKEYGNPDIDEWQPLAKGSCWAPSYAAAIAAHEALGAADSFIGDGAEYLMTQSNYTALRDIDI